MKDIVKDSKLCNHKAPKEHAYHQIQEVAQLAGAVEYTDCISAKD